MRKKILPAVIYAWHCYRGHWRPANRAHINMKKYIGYDEALAALKCLAPHGGPDYNRGFGDAIRAGIVNLENVHLLKIEKENDYE